MQTNRHLEELQRLSRALEPAAAQRAEWNQQVLGHVESYLNVFERGQAFISSSDEGRALLDSPLSEEPTPLAQALQLLADNVERPGVKLGAPGFLAFIPVSSLYPAALGDYLAAATNPYVGNFFASPGAVRLEHQLTRWMADVVGYPKTSAGDLTSGGSVANLSAILAAREAHGLKAREFEQTVVYLTEHTHHSVTKALRIAGLHECRKQLIPLDSRYRMRPEVLAAQIRRDRADGLRPWLVVATAGTTDTGALDPLPALAQAAHESGLWFHVDGAYGAMFALCQPGRQRLAGLELADSLTLDPHKGLFMPCGSGALLVKDGGALLKAYSYDAHYMQDRPHLASTQETSPSELSPELTRPCRGLRLWLSLKLLGVRPFRAALEEKLLLAEHFYQRLQTLKGFVPGPLPDLSIVTFRYVPQRGEPDEFNRQLLSRLQQDGRVFLTSTLLDGHFVLRLAILCAATHLDTIELALELLAKTAGELSNGSAATVPTAAPSTPEQRVKSASHRHQ